MDGGMPHSHRYGNSIRSDPPKPPGESIECIHHTSQRDLNSLQNRVLRIFTI